MTSTYRPISAEKAATRENSRVAGGKFGHQLHQQGSSLPAAGATAVMDRPEARWETLSMETFRQEQTPESYRNQMQFEIAKGISEETGDDVWECLDRAAEQMLADMDGAAARAGRSDYDAPTNFSAANLPPVSGTETLSEMDTIARRGDTLWQADLTALYAGAETARANGSVTTDEDIRNHGTVMAAVALNQRTAPEVLDRMIDTYLDGDESFRSHARSALINANTGEETLMKAMRRSNDYATTSVARDSLERRYDETRPGIFKWAEFKAVDAINDVKNALRG